jgi:tetratricopeptide (TPR) repeat protein
MMADVGWEVHMRQGLFLGVAAAFAMVATASFGMGGGGGGGGMSGGYGGGNASSSGFDDYATAVRLIHHDKFAEAVPYLNRALHERPNNADVLNYLGYTHRQLGDYPGSLDFYQRALAREPDHKGAHEYLGELYLKMNRLGDAQAQLAELTRLCSDGCEEKDVLTKAIADYQLASAAPAAAPTAVPATAPVTTTAPATPPTTTPSSQ